MCTNVKDKSFLNKTGKDEECSFNSFSEISSVN